MAGFGTYWHTLRHLRPVQIYGRARLRLTRSRADLRPAPVLREARGAGWVQPARRRQSMFGPSIMRFLNQTESLTDRGWDDPALEKLWRYNLHYFDDLNAFGASSRKEWHRALISRWVEENPPGMGTGWEPYPTSLRIVNWIKWSLAGNQLSRECGQSLAVQARWLARRLEIHLLGNHLLANAKALVFAGSFFAGPEADSWLETGLHILEREIPEQILADGGHFERSPMYHSLALADLLDLCNLAATIAYAVPLLLEQVPSWHSRIGKMRLWLAAMLHPDGEISYFNDAAVGIAPSPSEVEDYAIRLGFAKGPTLADGLTQLPDSGYIRVARDQAVVITDVGPIGPDYLAAHAHADTLSFEMSLFGQRILVNSGTSLYGSSPERLRQRGTVAHNTVVIDEKDSSEVWGGFRVARRARPMNLFVGKENPIMMRCSHDGYARLQGSPQHTRTWTLGENALSIEDEILGTFRSAEARFHLHPAVRIEDSVVDGDRGVTRFLRLPEGQRVSFIVEDGFVKGEPTTWHPEFGRTEQNICLVVEFRSARVRTRISWSTAA